jgi:hypothetical protein
LQATREAGATREAELKEMVDKLRHEKKHLEAKQGGVDLKQMQACMCVCRMCVCANMCIRSCFEQWAVLNFCRTFSNLQPVFLGNRKITCL